MPRPNPSLILWPSVGGCIMGAEYSEELGTCAAGGVETRVGSDGAGRTEAEDLKADDLEPLARGISLLSNTKKTFESKFFCLNNSTSLLE